MEHSTICKNCNHTFEGKYCNRCGQAANTPDLSLHYIWHDIQHGIFHFDNGIFYTIKQLLKRPGHSIREFINGKRIHHFKPLSLVVVLATFYGLLYHYLIDNPFGAEPINADGNLIQFYQKAIRWNLDHFAYTALLLVLTTTMASYWVFKKQGYNLAEHLVLNLYYRGLVLVVALLLFPVLFIVYNKTDSESLMRYALLIQPLDFILMYWCYAQFFNKLTLIKTLGLTTLTYMLMSTINMMIWYTGMLIANIVA